MKTTKKFSFLQFVVIAVLIAAIAVILPACSDDDEDLAADGTTITVTIEVIDNAGNDTEYTYECTPGITLADIVTSDGLASGTESEYGLYIDTVEGIYADYNADGAYWALYSNGEYLMTGASETYVNDGDHYEIVYTIYEG